MSSSPPFRFLLLLGLLLNACMDVDFTPAWKLDRLRVLAMSASPASLKPGDTTILSALVVDEPQNRPLTLLWLGCSPDPYNLNRSPCADISLLENPALLLNSQGTLENVQFLGTGPHPSYAVPEELFSIFPPEHPQRKIGTVGMVLLMVIAEALPEKYTPLEIAALVQRAQDKHVDSQIVLFRIPVREDGEPPNQNPVVSFLTVDGAAQHASTLLFLQPNQEYKLDIAVPQESFEEYQETTRAGTSSKTETLFASLFSSCGELEEDRFNFAASPRPKLLTPDGKDIKPCQTPIQKLFAVVYDSRNGQTWYEQPFIVCKQDGPSPQIHQAVLSPNTLLLEGEHLEELAELRVGEKVLRPLLSPQILSPQILSPQILSPQNGRMELSFPEALAPGVHVLSYVDFSCRSQTHGELSF